MISIKGSGDVGNVEIKKMKVITADSRIEATKEAQLKEMGNAVTEGETFVFRMDDAGVAMHPVESSNLGHLGWHNDEMFVTFKRKGGFNLYGYSNVSDTRFADLCNARSIGRRFGLMKSESLKDFIKLF